MFISLIDHYMNRRVPVMGAAVSVVLGRGEFPRSYSTGRHPRHAGLAWLGCEAKDVAFAGPHSSPHHGHPKVAIKKSRLLSEIVTYHL